MGLLKACILFLRAMLVPKAQLVVENLALRQQLAVLKHSVKRPKLRPRDRVFWVWLSRFWSNWRSALILVQPDQSSAGIARDSNCIGGGNPEPAHPDAHASNVKFVT